MAPKTVEFAVPDAATEKLLGLVASYGNCAITLTFKTSKIQTVEFKGENGESLGGVNTAARYLAGASPSASQLLGKSPADEAKVHFFGPLFMLYASCIGSGFSSMRSRRLAWSPTHTAVHFRSLNGWPSKSLNSLHY